MEATDLYNKLKSVIEKDGKNSEYKEKVSEIYNKIFDGRKALMVEANDKGVTGPAFWGIITAFVIIIAVAAGAYFFLAGGQAPG
jgi:hypothetical protein